MLEEKLKAAETESHSTGRQSFFGLLPTVRKYAAAAAIAVGSLIAYTGCGDEDTCKTNADCPEDTSCLRECERCEPCIDEDHTCGGNCDTRYRYHGENRQPGEQCGAYHCYRSSQTTTTTHTRAD